MTTPAEDAAGTIALRQYGTSVPARLQHAIDRIWARNPASCIGALILLAWLAVAVSVPLWTPYASNAQDVAHRLQGPSLHHLMGTDTLGRDVLSRTLLGSRISLPVAVVVIAVSSVIGTALGTISGYFGGAIDEVMMRVVDITLAFPAIVLAMAITAALGPSLTHAMIAMVAVWWPIYARLMRGQVLTVMPQDHVLAARALGAGELRLMARHIFPVALGPMVVQATTDFGAVVLLTAGLSFIGLGAVPPSPEWGALISDGRQQFYQWWIATAPGLAILSVVLSFNFLGDAVLDFLDPRRR
ncbi:MAG TPA: ABC transporter permease [Dehalococcoidia bacterium]|nr:ABC transporter permease [Dehalococcoidia bacterium]